MDAAPGPHLLDRDVLPRRPGDLSPGHDRPPGRFQRGFVHQINLGRAYQQYTAAHAPWEELARWPFVVCSRAMDDLAKALLSFALGAVGSYLGLLWKVRKDLEAAYDKDLRERRLIAYKTLWAHLEPLAKYARPGPVNGATLSQLAVQLRRWYFADGGIYLSDDTRDAYFGLQQALLKYSTSPSNDRPELTESEVEVIRTSGSNLRTWMARDVGTRRRSMVQGESSA